MEKELAFKNRLRSSGERITSARLGIYRSLARYSPVAMPRLLEKTREDGIDSVTCYRTLELFRRLGLVQDVGLGRHRLLELSDEHHSHHHHVWCKVCGKVTDFDSEVIEQELADVSRKLGISIETHQLEAYGVCANCA